MRIETKEKIIKEEIRVYVSCDGKEFNSAEECTTWENSFKCAIKEMYKGIVVSTSMTENLCDHFYSENKVHLLDIKDANALQIAIQYINSISYCSPECSILTTDDIGKKVFIGYTYDEDYAYRFGTKEEMLESLSNSLDKLLNGEPNYDCLLSD